MCWFYSFTAFDFQILFIYLQTLLMETFITSDLVLKGIKSESHNHHLTLKYKFNWCDMTGDMMPGGGRGGWRNNLTFTQEGAGVSATKKEMWCSKIFHYTSVSKDHLYFHPPFTSIPAHSDILAFFCYYSMYTVTQALHFIVLQSTFKQNITETTPA